MLRSFKQHPLSLQIDRERHRNFMVEALPHLIGGIITGALVHYVFRSFLEDETTTYWFALQSLLLISTIIFYSIDYKLPNLLSFRQWEGVIILVSALWGITWCMAPFIFLPEASFYDQENLVYVAALLIIVIALVITPAPAMVYYPTGYFLFASLPLAGMFIRLYQLNYDILLISFLGFFWLSAITYGWRLHITLIDLIKLRLEVDQARQQAESAVLAKSKFIAASSHDLRQPLQAISLFFSNIKRSLFKDGMAQTAEKMEASIHNMSELLDSLLDVSRLDANSVSPKPQHIKLAPQLEKLLAAQKNACKEKALKLTSHLENLTVYADPILLNRVLSNLLNNAVKYTPKGEIQLTVERQDNLAIVSVIDTGIGIPEEEQQAIFSEFHQLHNPERDQQKGLGLGLSIVQRLCTLQDWNIRLSSEVNIGSTFTIEVPLGDDSQIIQEQAQQPHYNNFNNRFIIVIDDDNYVRSSISELLRSWGAKVTACESLQQAISYCSAHSDIPDLIISDLRLRHEENGIQTINQLRHHFQHPITALLLTGDTDPERIRQAKQSSLVVLHKPVQAARLRLAIQRLLNDHPLG
ncbi:hybrid sensor histidine kinase/response regulator [Bacterioplanoides sp. SCSIO 12839]|uniref:hybrid sensor histidine kinase/response regulator n=1 Tax=Bacterioplanoides sp. SCSIO 12839 TaxID=2829569 RepID=UPI0021028E76|nr:hybrid sensor histidine kinase/response regulator [Bacterioplanoides sp. SCSIO 12839]UTW48154.1 hybrid sensor histidine kinase/response regulator [Bacterioplanoides sp. SCSIO 12839]